ncbi:hypothetical protein QVD17_03942 [Tagetes erecta]|uniref:Uncharacterized protein n=1 Tax=Tagetes erecta TaxID=13708 RepID=A0AAD8PA28_TARER|nr:hypothetical protein QVD17_03942 [Tagetes erecta]
MSTDHQRQVTPPTPSTTTGTGELHRQPSSSSQNNHSLPHTPSPIQPSPIETPGSMLAAALSRVLFNIPGQDPSTNTLLRTLSDANSSANHTTTTNIPRNNPLSRSIQPRKTPKVSSSPQSSSGKQSPQSEKLRKIEDMVREIENRCKEIMSKEEQVEEDTNPNQPQEQDECVGVERLKNGDLRFELCCSCGNNFEMLIENNGYCFYRLT